MQQLSIVHTKKSTNNVKDISEEQKEKDRRPGKGRCIALSRNVFRILNSDVYYVESENSDNIYYYCKYNFSGFEFCACPDNSTRHVKCKHLYAIEFAIRFGTLKDIDKLPAEAKRYPTLVTKSYRDEGYDF